VLRTIQKITTTAGKIQPYMPGSETCRTGLPVIASADDLTIVGNGGVIQRSTHNGTPAFRLFAVATGGSLTMNNLTLSRGLVSGYAPSGGAILNEGTLSLSGVSIQNSLAQAQVGSSATGGSGAAGGAIFSNGVLTIAGSTIQNNQALGGNGVLGIGSSIVGGPALGAGVYISGGSATFTNTTLSSNLARGGDGANGGKVFLFGANYWTPGGQGGDALGGAIYVAGGSLQIRGTTLTANAAQGGIGGTSPKGLPKGADGVGQGGGIYIAPQASVGLDSFTQAHTTGNTASTSDNDIFGSFTVLS